MATSSVNRSVINRWPGLWVIIKLTPESNAMAWGVNAHAQKTGTSFCPIVIRSVPYRTLSRSSIPRMDGLPMWIGVPCATGRREVT